MRNNEFFAAAFSLAFVPRNGRGDGDQWSIAELARLPVGSVTPDRAQDEAAAFAAPEEHWTVCNVESTAYAATYRLSRAADAAWITLTVGASGGRYSPLVRGALVIARRLHTGVVLTSIDRAVAFLPNALGRAALKSAFATAG
jgi:hypothetical protein